MASISDPAVEELGRRSALLEAEARVLRAEAEKSRAERALVDARRSPFAMDRSLWLLIAASIGMAVSLMGVGFAIVAVASLHR